MTATIRENFTHYLHDPLGLRDFEVRDWQRITDGWETDVYAYQLALSDRTEDGILRIFAGDSAAKARREYLGMVALEKMGYRVPKVSHLCEDRRVLGGAFILMERIFGQPFGRVVNDYPAEAPQLFANYIGLMVELHQLPPVAGPEIESMTSVQDFWVKKLGGARQLLIDQAKQTWTMPLLDWMESHPPYFAPDAHVTTLHNDYHPYNVLVTDERVMTVIDWPNIEVGDYRYDLAWTILLMTTYNNPPNMRDLILAEYERQAGRPIVDIEIYEAVAAGRRLIDMMMTMGGGAESVGMLPETVATMRRQVGHFQAVYAIFQDRSGLRLPNVEAMLAQLANGESA